MSTQPKSSGEAYWSATLKLLWIVLAIWAVVSYGAGILFVNALNTVSVGGYKLGFWFAQQGSIFVFVALIFWYARRMSKIDREHDVHEE